MNLPLSSSHDRRERKELIRLRMEMHRQQLLYNAQPLSNPLQHIKGMLSSNSSSDRHPPSKGSMLIAANVVLALFRRRLGKLGTLARIGLTLYPLIKVRHRLR